MYKEKLSTIFLRGMGTINVLKLLNYTIYIMDCELCIMHYEL